MPLPSTRWTVVARAQEDSPEGRQALEQLCTTYWYPLYAFARRRGASDDDAREHTQGFFVDMLEKDLIARADAERGRFRSFLFTSFKNYLSNANRAARAVKRGGRVHTFSIDGAQAEQRYLLEPATHLTADKIFERRWALTVLEQALGELRRDYAAKGKAALFERIEPCLIGDQAEPYATIASDLGLTLSNVKITVHRLRQKFREHLGQAIADTVEPGNYEDEVRHFASVLTAS